MNRIHDNMDGVRPPRRRLASLLAALLMSAALALLALAAFPGVALAAQYVVTSTADTGAVGTLRWAITQANASSGADTITFNITGADVYRISLTSALPAINYPLTIDATTQPGWTAGNPRIELNGTSAGTTSNGLVFEPDATGSQVRGLAIINFKGGAANYTGCGILIKASSCVVDGCHVGLDASGAGTGNGNFIGVYTEGTGNTIGGTTPARRNVISDNGHAGIFAEGMVGSGATGTVIRGNYIGTDKSGTADLGNAGPGLFLHMWCHNSIVGGSGAGEGNVVSGNGTVGIYLQGSENCVIQGNIVGLAADGQTVLGNGTGMSISGPCLVGGTTPGARNVVSGNGNGISITSGGALIKGNYVGTDTGGTLDRGNTGIGIDLRTPDNTVGGLEAGARNVISGNGGNGIDITFGGNIVQGNFIGLDRDGDDPLANKVGVSIGNCNNNTIGGPTASARNAISGNAEGGVSISNYSEYNVVQGNYVGLGSDGSTPAPNGGTGVFIGSSSKNNAIGGAGAGEGNVISCNAHSGVHLIGPTTAYLTSTVDNTVAGNLIGTDATGTLDRGNDGNGVTIETIGGSYGGTNTIGGAGEGAGNVISWNTHGVYITDATRQVVYGNLIGTDATGTLDCGNSGDGVFIDNCTAPGNSANTIGGTGAGEGNVISGNARGVRVAGSPSQKIDGNRIGTDKNGSADLGNDAEGVLCGSPNAEIAGNMISGNGADGVSIQGTSGCSVRNNIIGLSSTGGALGNGGNGVYLHGNTGSNSVTSGNTISANGSHGVFLDCSKQVIAGNRIGTDTTGALRRGNAQDGIRISGADGSTIGGTDEGTGNVISGNGGNGVFATGSHSPVLRGNIIGLNAAGDNAVPNSEHGIRMEGSAPATIGGAGASARNVISGNAERGVHVEGGDGHVIQGNFVGTDSTGTLERGNVLDGVYLSGTTNASIGGVAPGEGNVFSGNGADGLVVTGSAGCAVQGNVIGLDLAGATAVGNGADGLYLEDNSATNTIGGTSAAARNVISGNGGNGVSLAGCTLHVVRGNYIGTDSTGALDRGNGASGIYLSGANSNTIGGTGAGAGNVISGNGGNGVHVESSIMNTVQGNLVGTDSGGAADVGNGGSGVLVSTSNNTIIGGTIASARNTLSGNDDYGLRITGSIGCLAQNNLVGLDAGGAEAVGNTHGGVCLEGNPGSNTLGGAVSAARNIICGNGGNGVYVAGSAGQLVAGNYVGLMEDGVTVMGNGLSGVVLQSNSGGNMVGGISAGAGNAISGNGRHGVLIERSRDQMVQGNRIGTGADGTGDCGNGECGVYVHLGSANIVGGASSAERNVISGNGAHGVAVDESRGNSIQGNHVGRDAAGAPLGNAGTGVYVCNGADATTVGGSDAGSNLIADNGTDGVGLRASSDCVVSHNYVLDNAGIGVVVWDRDAARDAVSRNTIVGNGALGIDLLGDGVTPNDGNNNNPLKPNRGYNFPVITAAFLESGGETLVAGTAPASSMVEMYATGTPDPSGHGQALVYLGATTAGGAGEFEISVSGRSLGDYLCATATSQAADPSGKGNTSEFSANKQVAAAPSAPAVTTGPADGFSASGATLHGNILDNGGLDVGERGFRYRKKGAGAWTDLPDSGVPPFPVGAYSLAVTGLEPNTTYEFFTRARNTMGWGSGDVLEFTTLVALPSVTTHPADDFTASGATLNGEITGSGGEDPGERGFRYRRKGTVDWIDLPDGGAPPFGVGDYSLTVAWLEPNATYEFFARAHNSMGWATGDTLEFTTLALLPAVVTSPADSITASGATLNGSITDNGGQDADERGFRYRRKGTVDWTDLPDGGAPPFGMGAYSLAVTGLDANTTYEFFSRAHNSAGWAGGTVLEFTTLVALPTMKTSAAGNITTSGATLNGSVTGNGGEDPAERGFRYRRKGTKAWSDLSDSGAPPFPVGAYSLAVAGLEPNTTYEFFARARNSTGWASGDTLELTTRKAPPRKAAWYLAEGTCAWGFDTYITIANAEEHEVVVRVTYTTPDGDDSGESTRDVTLPARSQATVNPRWDVGDFDFSTKVEYPEGKRIAVDRTMIWTGRGAASPEAHNSIGAPEPAATWFLPEGSSAHGFETWTCVYNPDAAVANVTVTYMTEDAGRKSLEKRIPPRTRATYSMLDDIGEHDSSVEVSSDVPVVAERSTYRDDRRQGSCSVGAKTAARDFYLAEGAVGYAAGFTTWVLVQNPNGVAADVSITYQTGAGEVAGPSFRMPANSRKTVKVNDSLPVDTDVSTEVSASEPVVAERAMYWSSFAGEACHASIGTLGAGTAFLLPDGQSTDGRETWTLVQNPNGEDVRVDITYLKPDGFDNVTKTETIPAGSRRSFSMIHHSGIADRAAVAVTCLTPGRKIICERAMYWNSRATGTNTIGVPSD